MPEVPLDFPRAFAEFADPADESVVFRCDLTWLTSRWTCIFGSGCQGIDAARGDAGCCTLGAHFSDADDHRRVKRFVRRLGKEVWEHKTDAKDGGWTEHDEDGELKTRVVDGACIFHNSEGFPGGAGCALHRWALENDEKPLDVKPDVCWQLPIRRQFRDVERTDGSTYTEVSITEYDRRGWGAGGHDLDWYCSGNTEAHIGTEPVFRSIADELVALMGQPAYDALAEICADHTARRGRLMVHPATREAARRR
ncbi:MAG: hypothetical protein ACRDP1_03935 [Nocardioidaceae bacterium]